MSQTVTLLVLRFKQVYRYLREIGFGILIVALFILTGVLMNALQSILSTPAIYSVIASGLLLSAVEFRRKDQLFLKGIFNSKFALIRFKIIENIVITSPILLFQLAIQQWQNALFVVLVSVLFGIIAPNIRLPIASNRKTSLSFIPLSIFEIKFFFEKRIALLILIVLLLSLGVLHISLWILGIFILCSLPLEIYSPLEPSDMLSYSPFFVFKKIKMAMKFFLVMAIPPSVLTAVFHDGNLWIFAYAFTALLLAVVLAISKKYHTYYGVLEKTPSSTSVMLFTFLMLVPGGIIITLFATIYYYLQAENHLKSRYAIT